jgi:hypothetical protein
VSETVSDSLLLLGNAAVFAYLDRVAALRDERQRCSTASGAGYRPDMGFPRALTEREREVLLLVLPREGFAEVDVYRAQVDAAMVTGRCSCGCATINLEVGPGVPAATFLGTPLLPTEARGKDPSDPRLPVEIILFAREGTLESLEIVYYGDKPPTEFPATQDLKTVTML